MAEHLAPTGAFLVVELEPGINRRALDELWNVIPRLPGVRSVADLSTVPLELLSERVLLRLSAAEQRIWKRSKD
jgi:hypothetical protein